MHYIAFSMGALFSKSIRNLEGVEDVFPLSTFTWKSFHYVVTFVVLAFLNVFAEDPPNTQDVVLSEGDRNHVRVFSTPEAGETRMLTLKVEDKHRAIGKIPGQSGWSLEDGTENCMGGEEGGWSFGVSRCPGNCPQEVAIGFAGAPGAHPGRQFVTTITGKIYTCLEGSGGSDGQGGSGRADEQTFTLLITDEKTIHIIPNPANVAVSTDEQDHWVKLEAVRYEYDDGESMSIPVVVDWSHEMDQNLDFASIEGGSVMTVTQMDDYEASFIWVKSTVSGDYTVKATDSVGPGSSNVVIEGALSVLSMNLASIKGLRKKEVGNFDQETDPHADGRLFIDTQETWDGGVLVKEQYDKQRVLIKVVVNPSTINLDNFSIRWELRDPDDPADHDDLDEDGSGGDNTGTVHEGASNWFSRADHDINNVIKRDGEDENTIIGEAVTKLTKIDDEVISTVFFNFTDDGGDNFKIKAVLVRNDEDFSFDESGIVTTWRKRFLKVYAMSKPNDDFYMDGRGLGTEPGPLARCIDPGENNWSDTLVLGGDDGRFNEFVHAGENGIVETVTNSGGNNFDPKATQALFRIAYASSDPNSNAYLDFVVTNGAFNLPYVAQLASEDVPAYMHEHTDYKTHPDASYSLLGISEFKKPKLGNADFSPHCTVGSGISIKTYPDGLDVVNVHEVGHLLIGYYEGPEDFHTQHTDGQKCAFSQVERDHPDICPRHINMIRDRISRSFKDEPEHDDLSDDSKHSR